MKTVSVLRSFPKYPYCYECIKCAGSSVTPKYVSDEFNEKLEMNREEYIKWHCKCGATWKTKTADCVARNK